MSTVLHVPEKRLGRLPQKFDPRTLVLAKYLPAKLPASPEETDWSRKMTNIGPMLNNKIGLCGIAAPGHAEQSWTAQNGKQVTPTDDQILDAYEQVSGFEPPKPETDVGINMLDGAKFWRAKGIAGKKIESFTLGDEHDHEQVDFVTHFYGGAYVGLSLPESCQDQIDLWSVRMGGTHGSSRKGSWGGHAVWLVGYDRRRRRKKFISWGKVMEMTDAFWDLYVDEFYACLSTSDWVQNNIAPSGLDIASLRSDMLRITA